MAEKKTSVKYKFGQKELDMDKYIRNLGGNVQSYLEDRRKHGWTDDQVQEFSTAYNRYMDAFKQSMASGDNRFSTDDLGNITDTKGEFTNIDNDGDNGLQYYYNDEGERITNTDYDALKDKKKKNYRTFNANRLVAEYFRRIGNALLTSPASETEKFDLAKHGFVAWWNQKFNPAGGSVNLKPFLDKDPIGIDGKRPVSNRAKMAAGWMTEYLDWLKDKNLDYSNYEQFKDYDTYAAKGNALAQKWNDDNWDADDLIEGQAFGISSDFSNGFFTTDEDPDLSTEQREALAAALKAKEEELKQKDILEAKKKWIADLQAIFTGSNPTFTYDNPFSQVGMDSNHWYNADGTLNTENYYSAWGSEFLNPDGGINPDKLQTYIDKYVQNPFAAQYAGNHARNIVGLINSGIAQQIPSGDYQGMYYIPSKSDESKNRALIYDPNTKRMFYAFIGHVPQVWSRMANKYKVDNGLVDPNDQFMFKEGGVVSMQTGGDFGNAFVQGRNAAVEKAATNAGTNARKFLNDRRKISGQANAFDNQNGGFTDADYYHMAGLAGDVLSLVGSPVGAGIGLAGTTSHLIGDIKEDGFLWSDLGRAAVGAGLDLVGMIPGAGVTKLGKIGNGIIKIAPKLAAFVAGSAAVMNAGPILSSLKKATTDTSNMTIDDWRNVSQALILALGGARGAVNNARYNRIRPKSKTGDIEDVALDLRNKRTGEIETRKFTGDVAKDIKNAKSNKDIIAAMLKHNPALGEYELATSTSWIPKPQWVRKNGWIGDGWQYPVRFDSRRVRPMTVRTDKTAGDIEYATPRSPLQGARTNLVTQTKEEINEGIVKTQMDKLAAASGKYEEALKQQPKRLDAAKARKAAIDKAISDKKYTPKDAYEKYKSRGEALRGKGHDRWIDRAISRKYGLTEEGASKQQKYYEGLIKKLEELKADGHTKAYQEFAGRKNAEGIIEFATPGGEPIKRDFAELIRRYAIKHEEGGKFTAVRKYLLGNPIKNVQGNANWFDHMYSHPSMKSWLDKWTPSKDGEYSYLNFNKLQDSWWNNLHTTGYDPANPQLARGEGNSLSAAVLERQKQWNATGTNAAIEDAVNLKFLTRNGGTKDNPLGQYLDGYFGAQEYLRHGGTSDSWAGHDKELTAQREAFKKKGLDYYQDPDTGMYKLRPLGLGEVPNEEAVTSPNQGSSQVNPEGDGGGNNDTTSNQTAPGQFNIDPRVYAIAHNTYANAVNDKMTVRQIDAMRKGLTLYDLVDDHKYVQGDFDALMAGQQAAGQLMHLASQPLTADGRILTGSYTDSVVKMLDYIRQGRVANNQAYRTSSDFNWDLIHKAKYFNYDQSMKNRQSISDLIENIANVENARDAKNYTNDDVLFQEMMYGVKQKANKREALTEQFARSDIHNAVAADPNHYADATNKLTTDELDAWTLVQSGDKTYSQLDSTKQQAFMKAQRKISQIELNQLRNYYGIPLSKYAGARALASSSSWQPTYFGRKGGILYSKDGAAKIAVAKIRERLKDADRFQKTVKDKHDRIDKAIARVDKKMYRRRDPEKRRK